MILHTKDLLIRACVNRVASVIVRSPTHTGSAGDGWGRGGKGSRVDGGMKGGRGRCSCLFSFIFAAGTDQLGREFLKTGEDRLLI